MKMLQVRKVLPFLHCQKNARFSSVQVLGNSFIANNSAPGTFCGLEKNRHLLGKAAREITRVEKLQVKRM